MKENNINWKQGKTKKNGNTEQKIKYQKKGVRNKKNNVMLKKSKQEIRENNNRKEEIRNKTK